MAPRDSNSASPVMNNPNSEHGAPSPVQFINLAALNMLGEQDAPHDPFGGEIMDGSNAFNNQIADEWMEDMGALAPPPPPPPPRQLVATGLSTPGSAKSNMTFHQGSQVTQNKRERLLESNRVAAKKCRTRKKLFLENLKESQAQLTAENAYLKDTIEYSRKEINRLNRLLNKHEECELGDYAEVRQHFGPQHGYQYEYPGPQAQPLNGDNEFQMNFGNQDPQMNNGPQTNNNYQTSQTNNDHQVSRMFSGPMQMDNGHQQMRNDLQPLVQYMNGRPYQLAGPVGAFQPPQLGHSNNSTISGGQLVTGNQTPDSAIMMDGGSRVHSQQNE